MKKLPSTVNSLVNLKKSVYCVLRKYRTAFKHPHKLKNLYSTWEDKNQLSCVACIENITALLEKKIPEELKSLSSYTKLIKLLKKFSQELNGKRNKSIASDVIKEYTHFFRKIKYKKHNTSYAEDWKPVYLTALHIWAGNLTKKLAE